MVCNSESGALLAVLDPWEVPMDGLKQAWKCLTRVKLAFNLCACPRGLGPSVVGTAVDLAGVGSRQWCATASVEPCSRS